MILGPQSVIEKLLADALDREGIPYECQYRVYNKLNDLQPRYTMDFCIKAGNKLIGIECDGDAYHRDKKRDLERSAYLYSKGIAIILRFTTSEIKYNINYCVNEIKRYLNLYTGSSYILKEERPKEVKKKRKSTGVKNIETELPKVELYAIGYALSYEVDNYGVSTTMLVDKKTQQKSEVRHQIHTKITRKKCETLSILQGLQRLNRPCDVTIYTMSSWLVNVGNQNRLEHASRKLEDKELFLQIQNELSKHNYRFVFVTKSPEGVIRNSQYRELYSSAKQMVRREKEKIR